MASPAQSVQRSLAARLSLAGRRLLGCAVVSLGVLGVVRALTVEAFHVPTGSMAPALLGHHRRCHCPRCGQVVLVGKPASDTDGTGNSPSYRNAFCTNCGHHPLPVTNSIVIHGDQIKVDKTAYLRRAPSRWEILVFRLLDAFYIKRLLGLPGEEIRIHEGEVYANGALCRKTLDQARRMRVLVFEHEKAPAAGWKDRWEYQAPKPDPADTIEKVLSLRAGSTLTYQHFSIDARKCEPIKDEYAYNAGLHADSECVHDFMIETELQPLAGRGSVVLRLCDGQDWVEVHLPIGSGRVAEAFTWAMNTPGQVHKIAETKKPMVLRTNKRYHVEFAFVDRRLSLAIEGQPWLSADLPEPAGRSGVSRPFQVHANDVEVRLESFRLFRDVHYSQHGRHAVQGKSVRLGKDQYFMLGDNSANSEDSRCWPDEGRVHRNDLIGPVLR